jgi:hypothetical protein
MMRLDFEGFVHGVLPALQASAIAAKTCTMLADCGDLELEDGERALGVASSVASARAHPHMPWRRKTTSPLRSSGGSGSPNAAMRSFSYCAMTLDGVAERSSVMAAVT